MTTQKLKLNVVEKYKSKGHQTEIYSYEWDDGTITLLVAENKTHAFVILDEFGDASYEPKKLKKHRVNGFAFTFNKQKKISNLNANGIAFDTQDVLTDLFKKKGK